MLADAARRLLRALALALRMARRADRPLPYHLVYLAEACRCCGGCSARRRAPARAFRHQLGRGGDAGARARRPAVQLHRARAGGVRQARRCLGLAREGAARGVRRRRSARYGRSQLYRWAAPPHWPQDRRSCTAGSTPRFAAPPGRAAARRAAPGLRRPAVRAEGPAAAGRGGARSWRASGVALRARARRRRRDARRDRGADRARSA